MKTKEEVEEKRIPSYTTFEVEEFLRRYFGSSLKEMEVIQTNACTYVTVKYTDFRSEPRVTRYIISKFDTALVELDRYFSGAAMLRAIGLSGLDKQDLFTRMQTDI